MAQVCKLIQPKPVASNLLVSLVNVLQVVFEHLEPMQLLIDTIVSLSMSRNP
jgi:hypothetical protein